MVTFSYREFLKNHQTGPIWCDWGTYTGKEDGL